MHRTHSNSGFLQVFTMVLCLSLLLVPQMSSAGGLGDLFPSDIIDKIKSTDLKDIFRPSEKSKKTPDSAPAQDNSAPVAAVEEKKVVKPVETAMPVKASTPPAVAASPAVAKEAEEVKAWCYKRASVRIQHDCECVANTFIVERQADPNEPQLNLVGRITNANKCPNYEGIREYEYKQCIRHNAFNQDTGGHDPEAYCQCFGKQLAEMTVSRKGSSGQASRPFARVYCKKAEAYK